jgi:integrase
LLAYRTIAIMRLDSITSESVADYVCHRQSRGLEVGTVNRELRVLRRILRLGVEWGLVERAPKLQMLRGEKRRERVVADEEFEKYLLCASPILTEVATVLHDTGLRPDECHRLDWSDIAFVNGRRGKLLVRHGTKQMPRDENCP